MNAVGKWMALLVTTHDKLSLGEPQGLFLAFPVCPGVGVIEVSSHSRSDLRQQLTQVIDYLIAYAEAIPVSPCH